MQRDPQLLEEFDKAFREIRDGKRARPDLFGYSRLARQVHGVEVAVTRLLQLRGAKVELPESPVTGYELWLKKQEDDELSDLFGDIWRANPGAFDGGRTN